MTIPPEASESATFVAPKAQEIEGILNPYISLQSLESQCQGNETLEVCLREMVVSSMRYTETVLRFEQIVLAGQKSNEDGTRAEIERVRSTIHDVAIDNINILSRNLKNAGKDNSWISLLVNNRAAYGKFAVLVAFEAILQQKGNQHGQ